MVRGDEKAGPLTFALVIAGVGGGVATAVTSFFQELPWEVPMFIFLGLLFYGICRASFEQVTKAEREIGRLQGRGDELFGKLERQRGRLKWVLREGRQQRQHLEADKNGLEKELAAERATRREQFSEEELAARTIKGRAFHIAALARNNDVIRGWRFVGCDILGPAVVAPYASTTVDEDTIWTGEKPEDINWEASLSREKYVGAIGLDGCTIERCTFIRVGKLYNPEI